MEFDSRNLILILCFISIIFIPLGIFLIWKDNKLNKYFKMSLSLISGIIFMVVPWYVVYNNLTDETSQIIYEDYIQNLNSSGVESEEEQTSFIDTQVKEDFENTENSSHKGIKNKRYKRLKNMQTEESENEMNESRTVYVTPKGKRYHIKKPCGKGSFYSIRLNEAVRKGYTPCKRCAK